MSTGKENSRGSLLRQQPKVLETGTQGADPALIFPAWMWLWRRPGWALGTPQNISGVDEGSEKGSGQEDGEKSKSLGS